MSETRAIRLKERTPLTVKNLIPSQEFIDRSDETLAEGPFLVRTDEHGFIITGNHVSQHDAPIALIGGSFVESSFCEEGFRFIDLAERELTGFRLLNGGYSGSTTLQLLNSMISKIFPVIGDGGKLLFFVGQSDADVINRPGSYWTNERLWSPIVPSFSPHPSLPNRADAVEKIVKIVIDTARTLGIDLILASSPFRNADFSSDQVLRKIFRRNRDTYQKRQSDREMIRQITLDVGRSHGVDVIDFQELTGGNPTWFYDDLHLNEFGHSEFSKVLVKILRARI